MVSEKNVHDYAAAEQRRLIAQAAYRRGMLILPGLRQHAK